MRGSTNESITLTATVISPNSTETTSEATTITPTGNTSPEGSTYKSGWTLVETPYITVRPGDTLRISMEAKATNGSAWWSADDFGLTWQYIEPLPDAIEEIKNEKMEHTPSLYDLSGRRVGKPTKGLYIRDGRKVVLP